MLNKQEYGFMLYRSINSVSIFNLFGYSFSKTVCFVEQTILLRWVELLLLEVVKQAIDSHLVGYQVCCILAFSTSLS